MYSINQLISALLTAGGVGFINYFTLDHMGLIKSAKENDKLVVPTCLLFSLADYMIYLVAQEVLKRVPSLATKGNSSWLIIWSVIITIVLSFVITLLIGKFFVKGFYKLINKERTASGSSELSALDPFEDATADHGVPAAAYLYNFDHEPLGCGYITNSSIDDNSNYQFNLQPFTDESPEIQDSYDELIKQIQTPKYRNKYKVIHHINFKQSFILIVVESKTNQL